MATCTRWTIPGDGGETELEVGGFLDGCVFEGGLIEGSSAQSCSGEVSVFSEVGVGRRAEPRPLVGCACGGSGRACGWGRGSFRVDAWRFA